MNEHEFQQQVRAALEPHSSALVAALRERTGRKGRELFQPLRAALTHRLDGPELAALLGLLPAARVRERLTRARGTVG